MWLFARPKEKKWRQHIFCFRQLSATILFFFFTVSVLRPADGYIIKTTTTTTTRLTDIRLRRAPQRNEVKSQHSYSNFSSISHVAVRFSHLGARIKCHRSRSTRPRPSLRTFRNKRVLRPTTTDHGLVIFSSPAFTTMLVYRVKPVPPTQYLNFNAVSSVRRRDCSR